MRKLSFFIALFCAFIPALAQTSDGGLLWKISGKGLGKPSYLLGTWHGSYDFLYNFTDSIPGYAAAFASVGQVIGEVDMNPEALRQGGKPTAMLLPDSLTYADLLTDEQYELLDSVLQTKMDAYASQMRMRPFLLISMLSRADLLREQQEEHYHKRNAAQADEVMDVKIQALAMERGLTTGGLETPNETILYAFRYLSLEQETKILVAYLETGDEERRESGKAMIKPLIDAYRHQSLSEIELFERESEKLSDEIFSMESFMDNALVGRNRLWAGRLPEMITQTPSMIAVGVRHLPGKEGLLQMLIDAGYTVEPVK